MITADGTFRTVSADTNADHFWALRGGGGNFGIVTSIEFALHPVGRRRGVHRHPDGSAGGDALDRLRQLKTKYDPANVFRMNPNIAPG